jgi:hypothetical protein
MRDDQDQGKRSPALLRVYGVGTKEVFATGDSIWWSLEPADWQEAFRANPKFGERGNNPWAKEEQAAGRHASEAILAEFRALCQSYEERFGYAFVASNHARSAHSLIEALKIRMCHPPELEIRIAAEQQLEITHSRLKRMLMPAQ